MLHIRRYASGPPVVALHGFTATGAQFSDLRLRPARTIIAPDLPGHGSSDREPTDVDAVCASVAEVLESISPPAPLLGYSQGARIAILTTMRFPRMVDRLVIISGTAGFEDDEARRRRTARDGERAAALRSSDLEGFIDQWTSDGLTSVHRVDAEHRSADRQMRLENTVEGLARALEGYGQGAQPSAWEGLPTIRCPVLVVTGDEDVAYTDLGRGMAARMPAARHVAIVGAGHNPLLDRPEDTADAISAFLDGNG